MMKITFVNSGYAEGILIECPDESRENGTFIMTVDGGGANESEFAGNTTGRIPMWEYLKQIGIDHIDLMVSTHTHEDHICGQLRCAELLPPKSLWQTLPETMYKEFQELDVSQATNLSQKNFLSALNAYRQLCDITARQDGEILQIHAGYVCSPCKDLKITVLSPEESRETELTVMMKDLYSSVETDEFLKKLDGVDCKLNNFSIILMLEYQGKRILLPGDTNRNGFDNLSGDALRADLFKVGHHGQLDGASEELMQKVQPSMVVCCASSDRRYNSAHPDMIHMIESTGAKMYYSDCPVEEVRAHQALEFVLDENGEWTVNYI